jgi:hypothetical protein
MISMYSCTQPKKNLVGSVFSSEVVKLSCYDSLKFKTDSTLIFYSCEINWEFDCFYEVKNDTIKINYNSSQFEVDNYDKHAFNSKYVLLNKGDSLRWISIEHYNISEDWQLVSDEVMNGLTRFYKN